MKYGIMLIGLLLSSCASNPRSKNALTEKGKKVQVIEFRPAKSCTLVEQIIKTHRKGSVEVAKNHARNQAGKFKASHIHYKDIIVNGPVIKVIAEAYDCPDED